MTKDDIKREIKVRGITMAEVARRCGITPQTLNMRLHAKYITQSTIDMVATALGITPMILRYGNEPSIQSIKEENEWLRSVIRMKQAEIEKLERKIVKLREEARKANHRAKTAQGL